MAALNPGKYTLEVHYKSPVDINMGEDDRQTVVLQAFWTENTRAISDGIKCYPTPTVTNNYNSWGPLQDLKLFYIYQLQELCCQPISFPLKWHLLAM